MGSSKSYKPSKVLPFQEIALAMPKAKYENLLHLKVDNDVEQTDPAER